MAKRFILNETSYHGHGAVNEIVPEVKSRGFKKALIVTDADLRASKWFRPAWKLSEKPAPTT